MAWFHARCPPTLLCLNRDTAVADAEAAGEKHEEVKEEGWWSKNVSAKIPESIRDSRLSKAVFNVSPLYPGQSCHYPCHQLHTSTDASV